MAAFAATTPSLKVRALNDTRERRRRDPPALSDLARIGTMDKSRQSRKKKALSARRRVPPDARGDARRLARPRPNARLNLPIHVFSSQVAFRGQTAELKRGKVVKVRIPAIAAATSRVNSRQHGRSSSPPPTRPSTRNADLPPLHSLLQAAAVNTTTEAKVKVAINGFGRIGASRSRQSEPFSLRLPIASQDVSRNAIGPTAVVPSTPSDRRLVRRPVASRGSTVPHLDGSLRPVPSHGPLRSRP